MTDPVRSCILTRDRDGRHQLVRLALSPDGQIFPDVRAKAPGRGAWIGVTRTELEGAYAKGRLRGALARAFKTGDFTLSPELPALIAAALERNALDRLGLEARSGLLLTGTDKIETAARSGQLHALYHAADAGEDGMRKLAQAWRVGADREGSDLRGLALPVPRPILSLALGRENVVHIALTDRAAAKRVSEALDRWLHFIGPEPLTGARRQTSPEAQSAPCETASQGASAPGFAPARDEDGASPAAIVHEEFE
ncbi:DUF448 domain-containing protein [Sphingomonas sp. KR1UV-12]|uniref:DUF448 domain-containing protein n=1 Tax=Sphingomonas aurea TaxID=3063994 RepID=A0ABT9EPF5_9SPHN|nr:DUF448 domain-containing protein [Sphingomonas sp. KR1UV-12]MDP1028696.1 DUF448 domain-containing protein [Sphingomonas sp. KR1UV-12]